MGPGKGLSPRSAPLGLRGESGPVFGADGLDHQIGGYIASVLSEVSFLEAFLRAILSIVGLVVASGGVLAVMGFLSGRD